MPVTKNRPRSRRTERPRTTKKQNKSLKLTASVRNRELQGFINICFAFAKDYGYSPAELARRSGLSHTTIHRLAYGSFSTNMRVNTLQSIGAAVGLQLVMDDYKVKVVVSD